MTIHEAIRATFNSKEMKQIRDNIRNANCREEAWWDWTHGGCFGVANTIAPILKGKIYAVCEWDKDFEGLPWACVHAVVKVGKNFYDGEGRQTLAQLKKDCFTKRKKNVILPKSAKGVWYADDYYLWKYKQQIQKLLRHNLSLKKSD